MITVNILCKKCNRHIGSKDICECGAGNKYKFIKKCMPCGSGSGLYDYFICAECDPISVKRFIDIQNNIGYVGAITKAILNVNL